MMHKDNLQLCFNAKSRGLLLVTLISFAYKMSTKYSLGLLEICLSEMTLFLSLKDKIDWFLRLFF